jgi:methylated-DNA-[protein]-cysteine S-methyltransferase
MNRIRHLNTDLVCKTIPSPVGSLTLLASDNELLSVNFKKSKVYGQDVFKAVPKNPNHSILTETENQLNEYFSGHRKRFELPLGLYGTPFQKSVWEMLLKIPYGRTCAYEDIAAQIGDTKKARPVGGAVGCNPVGIIVPCHRVIGKNGNLTGFGGGLDVKTYLLDLEGKE